MDDDRFLDDVRREFRGRRALAERAMAQIDDDAFFHGLDADSNSVAALVKHIAGNARSRWRDFMTSDGEKSDRDRDSEFALTTDDTRTALETLWNDGWATLDAALEPLTAADLEKTVTIRGEPHSVAQAIQRQLGHYAYHVGQIVLLARHHAGDAWQTLSIARGGSQSFNRDPGRYIDGRDGA